MCLCRHPVHIQLRPLWPFLESNSAWRRPSLNHHPQQDNFECWWCWLGWTASILRVQWNPSSVCFFEAGNYCEIYPIKYLCRYKSIWPCSISKKNLSFFICHIPYFNCVRFQSFICFFGHENWSRTFIVKNKGEVQRDLHIWDENEGCRMSKTYTDQIFQLKLHILSNWPSFYVPNILSRFT